MRRPGLTAVVFATALLAVVAAALAGGLAEHRTTAFSAEVPATQLVARLPARRAICQGPIPVPSAFSAVEVWAVPSGRPAAPVTVTVKRPGLALSAGVPLGSATPGVIDTATAQFARAVPPGAPVRLCLRAGSGPQVALFGASSTFASGRLPTTSASAQAATLVFLARPAPTLIGLVPTIFTRAALLRPGWMGAWVYWVLLAGLLGAVLLLGRSLAVSARTDEELPG